MAGDFQVSDNMLDSLKATRPWVKFLAILGFILCGLMALAALAFLGGARMMGGPMASLGPVFGVVYLLLVVLYFFPCLYLFRYAGAIARIPEAGASAMEEALAKQKSFWKFIGILTAVILSLELLAIVVMIAFGGMMGAHPHP